MMILGGCITSAKFNMSALVLPQRAASFVPPAGGEEGYWKTRQNPVTGEIIREWINAPADAENPIGAYSIVCQANAVITGGLNSQGTTERWTTKGEYQNVDFVEMRVPPNVILKRRDRITNLAGQDGKILWLEEDHPVFDDEGNSTLPPTVFSVRGVAPSLDAFNNVMEHFVLLERAENQEVWPGGRGEESSSG